MSLDGLFENVRGLQGVKESTVNVQGTPVNIAVAHGLSNVEYVLNKVRDALKNNQETPYHFIEVMACPGGCIGGGGQPYGVNNETRRQRTRGIYLDDKNKKIRHSHENPYVKKLYEDYIGKPLGKKAHKLFHTKYTARPLYLK